jgi:hypothetical protein
MGGKQKKRAMKWSRLERLSIEAGCLLTTPLRGMGRPRLGQWVTTGRLLYKRLLLVVLVPVRSRRLLPVRDVQIE